MLDVTNDKLSLYQLLDNNIMIILLILYGFMSTGIQWLIPIPPYPYIPFFGLSEYFGIFIMYITARKILNPGYKFKIPVISKRIIINIKRIRDKKLLPNNYTFKNPVQFNKNILLIIAFITGFFILIPINDIVLSIVCAFVVYNYLIGNKTMFYIGLSGLVTILIAYAVILYAIIKYGGHYISNSRKYKSPFIIIISLVLLFVINKINKFNKKVGSYKEYIYIPKSIKIRDIFIRD